jgi:hypothetical protein
MAIYGRLLWLALVATFVIPGAYSQGRDLQSPKTIASDFYVHIYIHGIPDTAFLSQAAIRIYTTPPFSFSNTAP